MYQTRGGDKVLRFKALSEFLIDRGQQSLSLDPAPGSDPVRGKIGGDTQLEGQRTHSSRLGKPLLQTLFSAQGLT